MRKVCIDTRATETQFGSARIAASNFAGNISSIAEGAMRTGAKCASICTSFTNRTFRPKKFGKQHNPFYQSQLGGDSHGYSNS